MANDFAAQYDDGLYLDRDPQEDRDRPGEKIVVADSRAQRMHRLPEAWLRSRVRAWMQDESPGLAWWIGGYTAPGAWIWCSSPAPGMAVADTYLPKQYRIDYARNVCAHLDLNVSLGGAWLAGWARGGREFYLLWKDWDGDIKCVVEANKPFVALQKYDMGHWERVCAQALTTAGQWDRALELASYQTKKVAQGESVT